jgi:hypothetical protein
MNQKLAVDIEALMRNLEENWLRAVQDFEQAPKLFTEGEGIIVTPGDEALGD